MDGQEQLMECRPFELYNSVTHHHANPAVIVRDCQCGNDNDSFVSYGSGSSEHRRNSRDSRIFCFECNGNKCNVNDSGNWSLVQLNRCGLPVAAAKANANGSYDLCRQSDALVRRSIENASPNVYGPLPYSKYNNISKYQSYFEYLIHLIRCLYIFIEMNEWEAFKSELSSVSTSICILK